jgi:hypothetical protein
MNELITIELKNLRENSTTNNKTMEKEVERSLKKFKAAVKDYPDWVDLLGMIWKKSFYQNYNYFSLIDESGMIDYKKIMYGVDFSTPLHAVEFLTQWLHKFKPDARAAVSELIEKYNHKSVNDVSAVPDKYLKKNVHKYDSDELMLIGNDTIKIGEYCNNGIVMPRNFGSLMFDQLYNCTPIISLIKGDREYISFLHTWAEDGAPDVVDKQVKHWMQSIAEIGDIVETIFAPRVKPFDETEFCQAPVYLMRHSKKTIILNRNINEIKGIANKNGIYFKNCGYHLWES